MRFYVCFSFIKLQQVASFAFYFFSSSLPCLITFMLLYLHLHHIFVMSGYISNDMQ